MFSTAPKINKFRAALVGALAMTSVATVAWAGTQTVVIQMKDTHDGGMYEPMKVTVPAGTTVEFKNVGEQIHGASDKKDVALKEGDAASPAGAEPFDSGFVPPGQSYSYTFKVPGTYKYVCVPHEFGGMVGEIDVK